MYLNGFVFSVVGKPQCRENRDCRNTEVCHTGSCLDACLVLRCGVNAICMSHLHDVICKCPPGYTGNPESECILSMLKRCLLQKGIFSKPNDFF